ncbi:MAG: hypothetical protein ACI96M_004826 [Candidatus Azotimanducaceae bacterium]|jgi:hypothetical protein
MKYTITTTATFIALVLTTFTAHATDFNSANVGKFIQTLSTMQTLSDKYGEPSHISDMSIQERLGNIDAPFSSAVESIEGYQGYNEMADVIRTQGFGDTTEWALFGDRVMRAFAALKMSGQEPQLDAHMAKAMKELEGSGMSDAQKKMIQEMMQSAGKVVNSFQNVPDADKDAVRPHLSALENLQ